MPKKARVLSRELKLAAVHRMLAGENVSALACELKVLRKVFTNSGRVSDPAGRRRCAAVVGRPSCSRPNHPMRRRLRRPRPN